MSTLKELNDFLAKEIPNLEERDEENDELSEEYGFPKEYKKPEDIKPVEDEHPEPWIVNESGENSDIKWPKK